MILQRTSVPRIPPSPSTQRIDDPERLARWVESVERVESERKAEGLERLSPMAILEGLGLVGDAARSVVDVIEGGVRWGSET